MSYLTGLESFLTFEAQVFGAESPIPLYDPYLIRYGEYKFTANALRNRLHASGWYMHLRRLRATLFPDEQSMPTNAVEHVDDKPVHRGETVLDIGCEHNLFLLYLAYLGARVTGIDINPDVWPHLREKKERVEQLTGRSLDVRFVAGDVTQAALRPNGFDCVIAISSIEHMFSNRGDGDVLAIDTIARVLKPGGIAVVTLPMSRGRPFHEAPHGDANFGYAYRLYTPDTLQKRILSHPQLHVIQHQYLAQTVHDPRFRDTHFWSFWLGLSGEERLKWGWANPVLAAVYNPIVSKEDGESRLEATDTALLCLRKSA